MKKKKTKNARNFQIKRRIKICINWITPSNSVSKGFSDVWIIKIYIYSVLIFLLNYVIKIDPKQNSPEYFLLTLYTIWNKVRFKLNFWILYCQERYSKEKVSDKQHYFIVCKNISRFFTVAGYCLSKQTYKK